MADFEFPYRTSFWYEQPPSTLPALVGESQVDVAVIGGGFAGLSAARYLKQTDPALRVALLEGKYVGFGASGRNGGGVSLLPPLTWLMRSGQKLENIRWAADYVRTQIHAWAAWIKQEQVDCDLRSNPLLISAGSRYQKAVLNWLTEQCKILRCPFNWVSEREMREKLSYGSKGGIILDGYTVQPYKLARGLLEIVLRLGAAVYENTRVARVKAVEGKVEVLTESGARLVAEKVVLATNAYSGQLELGQKLPTAYPLHTYVLATEPLDQATRERILYEGKFVADSSTSFYYGRLYGDQLLFGGTDRFSKVTPADDQHLTSFKKLYAEMRRRFPYLADVPLDAAWGGPFHQTPSETPIIKPLENTPNVILNIGYGGSGVALTQLSGRMVQGLVLGERYVDADAEHLRQMYLASTPSMIDFSRTGLRILTHFVRGAVRGGSIEVA